LTAPARPLLLIAISIVGALLLPGLLPAATSSDSSKHAVEHATELWKAGDADAAIAYLQKSTESNPSPEAYHLLGKLYFKAKKRPREAAEALTHALKLKPAYPDALNDLAEVYLSQGKGAEAEQTLKRAIEIEPKHQDSYLDLGMTFPRRCRSTNVCLRLVPIARTDCSGWRCCTKPKATTTPRVKCSHG
jgi:tetratricopeptide (TPR) repeat protein